MTIFSSFVAMVAGLLLVLDWFRPKLTLKEFTTLTGLALLVASSVGLVIGMNEIANPLHLLAIATGVGVIWMFFFERKRCQNA
jgi:hypothetical protein